MVVFACNVICTHTSDTALALLSNQFLGASLIIRLCKFSAAPASTVLIYASATRHTPVSVTHAALSALSFTRRIQAKCHRTERSSVWTLVVREAFVFYLDDFGYPAIDSDAQRCITNGKVDSCK